LRWHHSSGEAGCAGCGRIRDGSENVPPRVPDANLVRRGRGPDLPAGARFALASLIGEGAVPTCDNEACVGRGRIPDGRDKARPHAYRCVSIALSTFIALTITVCSMPMTVPHIHDNPLSYVGRLDERAVESIELVVIHATELPDLSTARDYGEQIHHANSKTGNSGHFYIDRDGSIEQWVPLGRVAHHVRDHNARSIGIELVNRGRWPDWFDSRHQQWQEDYSRAQIESLVALLRDLKNRLPNLGTIAGHDELDTGLIAASDDPAIQLRRKVDPGPLFPWDEIESRVSLERSGMTSP